LENFIDESAFLENKYTNQSTATSRTWSCSIRWRTETRFQASSFSTNIGKCFIHVIEGNKKDTIIQSSKYEEIGKLNDKI
jgi:hypothetical protein